MKKIITIICLCLIISAFVFMFVFSLFMPRTTVSDYTTLREWPKFSFETLFSGEYISDVMYCFTDTIHARDRFVDYEAKISDLYGIKEEQELIQLYPDDDEEDDGIGDDVVESSEVVESSKYSENDVSDSSSSDISETSQETSQEMSQEPEESAETSSDEPEPDKLKPELSGSIIIVGTRALEIYNSNEASATRYAQIINDFAKELDDSVNVYSMVIPKSSAYYLEFANGYDSKIYDNKKDIDKISEVLSDRVIDANVYNTLGIHANEAIYFRTDHHWTALGAYYASSVFADKAGVGFSDISTFREERREGYIGTMYKFSNYNTTLSNNPEDFVTYYPNSSYTVTYYDKTDLKSNPYVHSSGFFWRIGDNAKSSWYMTYLNGDNYSLKAVSDTCKNGRKLLLVKDSYGNTIAPNLLESFEEIYVVDARFYDRTLKDTINEFGITDVLFAECTFSATSYDYQNQLKELCK